MPLKTSRDIDEWIHRRGGLTKALPRLRSRVKAGHLSGAEIDLVKEYLAGLDISKLSQQEQTAREARKLALADSLEAPPATRKGNTALVTSVVMMAVLAAAFIVRS